MSALLNPIDIPSRVESPLALAMRLLFEEALNNKVFSGAGLLVSVSGKVVFENTWGYTQENGAPVSDQTQFDLASLTKPLVTTALCMWAVSQRVLDLEDPMSRFFPFRLLSSEKEGITIRQLLSHCSGFPPHAPYYKNLIAIPSAQRYDTLIRWILETPLLSPPGKTAHYSDLGFLLLGILLERVTQTPLDKLASQLLFEPLSIEDLSFYRREAPPEPTLVSQKIDPDPPVFVATEHCLWRKRLLQGEVHNENAYCLGGVAGHAGLFGTARGVWALLSFLWEVYRGKISNSLWSPHVVNAFWRRQGMDPESTWALGFDTPSLENSSAGTHFSARSVGHLGFTGTSFWMDLDREVFVVLLTNRVYPSRENNQIKTFRPLLHNRVMEALYDVG